MTPDSGLPPYPPRAACVIEVIYDQSGNNNHMLPATPAINNPNYDNPVNATRHPITIGGHAVYGAFFESGMGYRAQKQVRETSNHPPTQILTLGKPLGPLQTCPAPPQYDGCRTRQRRRNALHGDQRDSLQ